MKAVKIVVLVFLFLTVLSAKVWTESWYDYRWFQHNHGITYHWQGQSLMIMNNTPFEISHYSLRFSNPNASESFTFFYSPEARHQANSLNEIPNVALLLPSNYREEAFQIIITLPTALGNHGVGINISWPEHQLR